MAAPKVSVIIPTCGRPQLLLDCVASILRNDFTDFEILVVDQEPHTTLAQQLASRFNGDPRVMHLFLDYQGASRARNLGIRHAKGELLAFVDDDLEVVPEWLRAHVDAFDTVSPVPGVVAGRIDPLWLAPRPHWLPEEREYLLGLYSRDGDLMPLPEGDLPMTANCAVTRQVLDEVGVFDERIGFSYARPRGRIGGEDSLLALQIKRAGHALYYQPRARAFHKISEAKLTKTHFVRYSFWEGVTAVVVSYLSNPGDITGTLRRNMKAAAGHLVTAALLVCAPRRYREPSKLWMHVATRCARSLGIICSALTLLWTRRLP